MKNKFKRDPLIIFTNHSVQTTIFMSPFCNTLQTICSFCFYFVYIINFSLDWIICRLDDVLPFNLTPFCEKYCWFTLFSNLALIPQFLVGDGLWMPVFITDNWFSGECRNVVSSCINNTATAKSWSFLKHKLTEEY